MKAPGPSGEPDDYSIDHSAALVLLDPQVRMAGVAQPPFDIRAIAADLERLTKATP
ncbi:MAG TPA: SCO family protein, partial [Thermomonas sp.]|nr:SCO family protein [Thermomonas sp.]